MSTTWAVELEAEGDVSDALDDNALTDLMSILEPYSPSISASRPTRDRGPRYGATLWVDADDIGSAMANAVPAFHEAVEKASLPPWPVVRLEVMTEAQFDDDLASRAFPVLIGVSELAELLGVTRQRASMLAKSAAFPRPVADLYAGPVWTEPSVRRFIDDWERKPGRRKASDALTG